MITTRAKHETEILIQGPAGKLEMIFGKPSGESRDEFGIICHPHSLFGGTMHNKVVTTIARAFQHLGLHTIRFNFRSVGKSEGKYDAGNGELEDLIAVIDWIKKEKSNQTIWLAGFSFGAYVAAKAATQLPIKTLVTVAPSVEHFPMQKLGPILCPWILVQGLKDEVVSPEAVLLWAKSRDPRPIILEFPEATHFFHGQLTELRMRLEKALKSLT